MTGVRPQPGDSDDGSNLRRHVTDSRVGPPALSGRVVLYILWHHRRPLGIRTLREYRSPLRRPEGAEHGPREDAARFSVAWLPSLSIRPPGLLRSPRTCRPA
jgi:hypothetical protein